MDKIYENICKFCGRKFQAVDEVRQHLKLFHEKVKCQLCSIETFGEKALKVHQQTFHTAIRSLK